MIIFFNFLSSLDMFTIFNCFKLISSPQSVLKKQCLDCMLWKSNHKISTKTKDHYEVLNLSRNCTTKEIRDAFITLSKRYHPDKNKGNPKAQEEFVRVSEAYNVLIKQESRQQYDFSLKNFSGPSRVYKSGMKDDFYEVHRYDSDYRDPWKDPSFYRNRNFDEEAKRDNYYGIRGLKKVTNRQFLFWILLFTSVGIYLQFIIIRFANASTRFELDRRSEENRRYLEYVRKRAEQYGTLERQVQEFNRRAGYVEEDPTKDTNGGGEQV